MNKELNDRILGIVRRATTRTISAADSIAAAGGSILLSSRWGRHADVAGSLDRAITELRAVLEMCEAARELADGEKTQRVA